MKLSESRGSENYCTGERLHTELQNTTQWAESCGSIPLKAGNFPSARSYPLMQGSCTIPKIVLFVE